MAEHTPRTIERHTDVAVVGGSAAGLAAALQLGRQRLGVVVIDDGRPRNEAAGHMHGYLGHEGAAPADLIAIARDEVRRYGGEVLRGRVVRATRTEDHGFRVEVTGGHAVVARRLLVATGLVDELPDITGVPDHWGGAVVHCPFCHGYEVRDQRIVQVVTHPMALHTVPLWRRLAAHHTLVVADSVVETAELDRFVRAGVDVERGEVSALVTSSDGRLLGVRLADGRALDAAAVVVTPRFHPRLEAFTDLELAPTDHASGLGSHLVTGVDGTTAAAGVYAAGNVTDPGMQVLHAAANGSRVGAMIAMDLAGDDLADAARRSANEADWDERYRGEQIWSGNPNGSLVHEVSALTPGRALDVGAGEGGDAVWLAERGWEVVATDVTRQALARIEAEASRRGVAVTCRHIDANAPSAFERGAFDLVSAQYASIPRTADDRAVHNMARAVAPGGLLLVVGHDLEPMRRPNDPAVTTRIFDPDAYVRVDDVARVLADDPSWMIEVHETRPRPAGAASSHHVDDVVLRARRIA